MQNLIEQLNWLGNYEELVREKARRDFNFFLKWITPQWSWDWPHLLKVQEYLNLMIKGDIEKLMIFMPPRHGKSEMTTVRFPVWLLNDDPEQRIIIGAYNQTLANKFSRKARNLADPILKLSQDRTAVEDWETTAGGGMRAVGVGGGITGQGGNWILIDDPVKNREEANSETYREKVWTWYTDDLYTRREPGCKMILQMTRWHEDDLAGRIMNDEDGKKWTVLRIPAIAEGQKDRDAYNEKHDLPVGLSDPLLREPGAPLCEDRYTLDDLNNFKTVLGSVSFSALYQQNPINREGDFFKVEQINVVGVAPANISWVRYWDKAGTQDGGKRTAGVKMGRGLNGIFYIDDVVKGQWSSYSREQSIKQTAGLDGIETTVWVEQEPGSGGKESAENTIQNLAGFSVYKDKVTGAKETRWEPLAAQVEAGNVCLVRGDWNKEFIEELRSAPNGKFKDQIDAAAGAFAKLNAENDFYMVLGRARG